MDGWSGVQTPRNSSPRRRFYSNLDTIEVQDPKQARSSPTALPGYRESRLWLEALLRKTPVPYGDQALTVSRMLADALAYQQAAVAKLLIRNIFDPES